MRIKLKEMSVRFQIFISFTACYLLALSLFFAVLFNQISMQMKQNADNLYMNIVKNTTLKLDFHASSLDNVIVLLNQSRWVESLQAYSKEEIRKVSYIDMQTYKKELNSLISVSGLSSEIAIFFKDSGYVISSTELSDIDWYTSKALKVSGMDIESWRELLMQKTSVMLGPVDVTSYHTPRRGYIYMRTVPMMMHQISIMMFIELSTIENHGSALASAAGAGYVMLDKEGKLIAGNAMGEKAQAAVTALQTSKQEKVIIGGKAYSIYKSVCDKMKWQCALVVPSGLIGVNGVEAWGLFFLLMLGLLVVGGFLFWVVSSLFFKKFLRLFSVVGIQDSIKNGNSIKNEFYMLEDTIKRIMNQENDLNRRIEQQKPMMQAACLSALLKGELPKNESTIRSLQFLGIDLSSTVMCMCILKGIERKDAENAAEKAVEQIINVGASAYRISIEAGEGIIVFASQQSGEKAIEAVRSVFETGHSDKIYGGMGRFVEDIWDLRSSFEDARIACKWRLLKGRGQLIAYNDIQAETEMVELSPTDERQLINFIRLGDEQEAIALVKRVATEVKSSRCPPDQVENLFIKIWSIASEVCQEAGLEHSFKGGIPPCATIDELCAYTYKGLQEVMEQVRIRTTNADIEHRDKILDFVESNLVNKSLSLKMLSSEFDMSVSALSRFFSKEVGENFHSYVQSRRVALAKKLLFDTEVDIQTIAEQAGFDNDITFRRAFKKIEGVTPGSFRGK